MKKRFELNISMKRLRRLAARAIYIVNKLRKEHPALEAVADAMVATFQRFVQVYDLFHASEATARSEVEDGRREVERLQALVRTWLPIVGRDVAIDTTRFRLHTDVPDDIIAAARLLLKVIAEAEGSGVSLSYAAIATEALEAAAKAAEAEWHDARTAITHRQIEARALREAASAAQAELVALRQVIQATLGRSSLDYQALRADKGANDLEDDSEADDTEPSIATDVAAEAPAAPQEGDDRESGEFSPPASVAS